MPAKPPAAVVFDIGNVLVEWNPARMFDRVIGPDRRARLFAEVELDAMNEAVDLGAPLAGSVAALAARHPGWADAIGLWHDNWSEMFGPPISGTVTLLRDLRAAGVAVFALSNFGRDTFAVALAQYPFLSEFDRSYVSAHLGVIKPDPAIYAHVEADSGLPPDALLFIDDRPDNIAAARARGWRGHLFDGPDGLALRLAGEGLLPRRDG